MKVGLVRQLMLNVSQQNKLFRLHTFSRNHGLFNLRSQPLLQPLRFRALSSQSEWLWRSRIFAPTRFAETTRMLPPVSRLIGAIWQGKLVADQKPVVLSANRLCVSCICDMDVLVNAVFISESRFLWFLCARKPDKRTQRKLCNIPFW